MPLTASAVMRDPFRAGLFYLAVPVALFLSTWLQPALALAATTCCVVVAGAGLRSLPEDQWPALKVCLPYAGLAIFLSVTSGTSPLVNGTPFLDLAKHRWIFHDLTQNVWPVVLEQGVVRYALGFYLVPAAIAKLLPAIGYWAATVWLAFGMFLMFCAIDCIANHRIIGPVAVVAFAFFSGLDVIYFAATHPQALSKIVMLEAWARDHLLLIGSNPFNLSWTPQHAMAAWLGTALIYRNRNSEWPVANAGMLVTALALWSPFVAIAGFALLAPFAIVSLGTAFNRNNWISLAPAIGILAYLATGDAATHFRLMPISTGFAKTYVWFVVLEFGILAAILLAANGFRYWIVAPVVLLLALPFPIVGTHDLQMRASVVGITFLFLVGVSTAVQRGWRSRAALAIVAVIGMWAGANEYLRVLRAPVEGNMDASIASMPPPLQPQYLTHDLHYLIGLFR